MPEMTAIVLGILLFAAFFGGKVGYRLGVKHAATKIADFFAHEIPSTDNDLKSVPELLRRRSLTDDSLWRLAGKLHFAAFNDGTTAEARSREPKPEESVVTMNTADLETVPWLADSGLRVWIAADENSFRMGSDWLARRPTCSPTFWRPSIGGSRQTSSESLRLKQSADLPPPRTECSACGGPTGNCRKSFPPGPRTLRRRKVVSPR